jgi:hypothetical protein
MGAFGGAADARIEGVAGIKLLVVLHQGGFGVVKVANVVFCRIFGSSVVEQYPHPLLKGLAVRALRHDVVLVEDVAEEVTVVELVKNRCFDIRRQPLEPLFVIATQRNVEGDNVLDSPLVSSAIAKRGAGCAEAMKESLVPFIRCAFKEVRAPGREDRLEACTGLVDAVAAHLQHEMVLETVPIRLHALRRVFREEVTDPLHGLVAQMMGRKGRRLHTASTRPFSANISGKRSVPR